MYHPTLYLPSYSMSWLCCPKGKSDTERETMYVLQVFLKVKVMYLGRYGTYTNYAAFHYLRDSFIGLRTSEQLIMKRRPSELK